MKKPTVLIIDDERNFLESLSFTLADDFHILTASGGRKGLSLLNKNPVSAMILDLDMPDMTGVEVLQKIRQKNKSLPVLILTGRSSHEWAKRCADMTVQGYIEKPVDIEGLIDKIKNVIGIERIEPLKVIWGDDYEEKLSSLSSTVSRALYYIQENYRKQLAREDIAAYLSVSPGYLSRQFHKECGIRLIDYINMLKICTCKECLMDFDKKVIDIAELVGIHDVRYLYKLFKKYTGLTVQEFRSKHVTN